MVHMQLHWWDAATALACVCVSLKRFAPSALPQSTAAQCPPLAVDETAVLFRVLTNVIVPTFELAKAVTRAGFSAWSGCEFLATVLTALGHGLFATAWFRPAGGYRDSRPSLCRHLEAAISWRVGIRSVAGIRTVLSMLLTVTHLKARAAERARAIHSAKAERPRLSSWKRVVCPISVRLPTATRAELPRARGRRPSNGERVQTLWTGQLVHRLAVD